MIKSFFQRYWKSSKQLEWPYDYLKYWDIRYLKLLSREELIGVCVSETKKEIVLKDLYLFLYDRYGKMTSYFIKYMPFVENRIVVLNKSNICAYGDLSTSIKISYLRAVETINNPPKPVAEDTNTNKPNLDKIGQYLSNLETPESNGSWQ